MTAPTILPDVIRLIRKQLGLTQQALADALGLHVRTVYDWEHARFKPRGGDLENLVKLWGGELRLTAKGWVTR